MISYDTRKEALQTVRDGTADAFDEDRKAASECGMNGFISKPIDLKEVIHALNSVFD